MGENVRDNPKIEKELSKNFFNKVLILIMFFFIVSIALNIYLLLARNKLIETLYETRKTVVTNSTENIKTTPEVIYSTKRYSEVQLNNIEDFFDNTKFPKRAVEYLVDKGDIKRENIVDISCTNVYTSGYRGYEESGLYLYFPNEAKPNEIVSNKDDYKLKDEFLLSFINDKNKEIREKNPDEKIRDISKCETIDGQIIVSYYLSPDYPILIDYFRNSEKKEHFEVEKVDKSDHFLGCEVKPFAFTSNQNAYYICGSGDAGTNSRFIYKISLTSGISEEMLNCTSEEIPAINAPPPERHCWEPYKFN